MDFVALLSFRPSVGVAERDGALMRRAAWKYLQGVKAIAEYWPASASVQVVSIFSADTFEALLELELEWSDVFEIAIYPAVGAEEGLRMGPDVFARLSRTQQAAGGDVSGGRDRRICPLNNVLAPRFGEFTARAAEAEATVCIQ